MAGIQSLLQGPQGQQGLAPGQAQQAPLPGMLPRPTSATPEAEVTQYAGRPTQELIDLFQQRPTGTLMSVIEDRLAAEDMQARVARQMAMGQAAQMGGMSLKDALQQKLQARGMRPTRMAAHGGIMQGYAGGGAVAFTNGGNPTVEQILQKAPSARTPEENEILRASGVELTRRAIPEGGVSALNKMLEGPFFRRLFTGDAYKLSPEELSKRTDAGATTERMFRTLGGSQFVQPTTAPAAAEQITDTGDELARMLGRAPAPVPMSMRDTRGAAPGPSASPGGQRQAAAPAPAPAAPITGLPALSAERRAEIAADQAKAEKLAADQAAVVERLSKTSPEVLAARENLQRIMGGAYDPQKKTLEEAKDLFARGIGGNAEALGRMAAAMGGAKRFGQGLAAAAGAGAEFVGEQRKRVQALQDEYNKLQSQLSVTMAQAEYADVIGDDKLKREALTKAEEIKKSLFDTQRGIRKEAFGEQVQQATGIAALQKAQADLIQAGKPDAATAMLRAYAKNPELVKSFFSAQTEGKAKNPFDMINDNAQRLYSDWLKSTGGMTATEAQRAAMWQQIFDQQIAAAARFGVKVPEAGAAPAKGTKDDPIKLG
jgi:hypothetical protein